MYKYDKVQTFVKESEGIYLTEDFTEANIDKYYIQKLLDDGIIEKYDKGVYLRNDVFEDELYILQRKNPTIVYSYNTAMFLHNMTERTPDFYDVTVYSGYNASHLPKNMNVHFVKKENHHVGLMKVKTMHGFEVNTYNLERITCDIIRTKNIDLDKEQINKFIRKVFLEERLDTIKLIDYARQLRCEKKVRQIMEVFM